MIELGVLFFDEINVEFIKNLKEENAASHLVLVGDWTVNNFEKIKSKLQPYSTQNQEKFSLKLDHIRQLDTAGVLLIADTFGRQSLEKALENHALSKERQAMIQAVIKAIPQEESIQPAPKEAWPIRLFENVGLAVSNTWKEFIHWIGFFGMVIASFLYILSHRKEWRMTSLIANIDNSGFKAAPIVMLLCFMVGAVVAFLGATVLESFGAQVYTVHLVTYSFLREFAIILTAILVAGRTASAYTAQLGSMKVNEEIDALRASGVDPLSILVVPRVLALIIAMPILTFLGMLSGILGGMLVAALSMDISPRLFFDIINNTIDVKHFLVGIGKAPIFAVVVAITGCLEGFNVSGSAESVGQHTTASVVKCIFLVILLDALFAIFFMEMGW
ncbi:ABC transporter permease [Pelistega sp. NLN82]|uniref:ABC transporter permease n=1 Tax=Pelistega ratti TaxID=2652177 RepID=A0A6L9Y833_9BURK|nr:ABC transporter permease [Pelistega ratti]